jgi:predicted DsbA family dithiol-disulfide isomerase
MPREVEGDLHDYLARKLGRTREDAIALNANVVEMAAGVGLDYQLDRVRPTNTLDAHQMIRMASAGPIQQAVTERLFHAYFVEGADLGDHTTLIGLGVEAGLDAAEIATVLDTGAFAEAVVGDTAEAQSLGLNAVPAFVLDRRFAVSGAQGEEVLLGALQQAYATADADAVAG